ncbi:ASKHA domain-containing protein [Dehalobacter sp. DCM]|uniref:ASKHA domain-containing protein n=1 Tax=Dehalobacter sp. DCM TaxID=2907827 RepID=UPI0030814AED|nr:ASKHA domain-containing protein [Dehalobacter sp. DCM]
MIKVLFPNQNAEIHADENETIAVVSSKLGYPLDLVCGGKGTCQKCKVEIEKDGRRQEVLACQEKVSDGLIVYLTDDNIIHQATILTESLETDIVIESSIRKIFLDRNALKTPAYEGDWEHIAIQLGSDLQTPELPLLQKLSVLMQREDTEGLTFTMKDNTVLDIEINNTVAHNYGLAADLGSTSVVIYLFDLNNGKKLGTYSALNGQIAEGADVISRIMAAINHPDGIHLLQSKVVNTINDLIDQAVQENRIQRENIYTLVICGNSAMQHLFLGLHPGSLGKSPYKNVILGDVEASGKELGIGINPHGIVHFLPLIGGFVGADTSAVLLALPESELKGKKLIIDLGTNGEILLGNGKKWLATSCAAGPALEGATIHYGMRGTNGAIERVKLANGAVKIEVIGKEKAKGICGSGIVDAIGEMFKAGLITEQGRMLTRENYLEICSPENAGFADNLDTVDGVRVFYLTDEDQTVDKGRIYIDQRDIRSVQLAKSALYTGCVLLLDELGMHGEDLDEILIAGAFGNYIDADNAQVVGLFPKYENVPIRSIGNAAGAGSTNYLLSRPVRSATPGILATVGHFELAAHPSFQEKYLENTKFEKIGNNY